MVTLLVATIGGHLAELAERLPDDENHSQRLWVTQDHLQGRSLLADETVACIADIGTKDVPGVLRNVAAARRWLRQHRPTRAVSTGSAIALSFLPSLAARGVSTCFIESATRVAGPSLSGRLLRAAPGLRLYTQYRLTAGGRWLHRGSVFDGFTSVKTKEPPRILRAVVTLGTETNFTFRRLLDKLAPILRRGGALERAQSEPVDTLWQTGGTPAGDLGIVPRACLSATELNSALAAADVVVSHARVGSDLAALRVGRFPVLVPRKAGRGENCDEHQQHLARELAQRGLALHRGADELTIDDLRLAAAHHVERAVYPPKFELLS